ncbi:ECF transporter S component [uncultured Faecalicoccus sp.]|uniref:ECF transporter S component n=1 Tax=uncultured Faecalicoccus sp. TaxID=1971760 RepID=UPI0026167736|nr:ECF transporter S component [uncultured Faecalicoccus sp.]
MSKKSSQIRNLTMLALFLAIEVVLLVTPLGYLRIGVLSATLMHVPVIVCACTMGTKYGVLMGLVFGVTSVINATMAPTVTSFAFSPFVEVGGFSGGFQSLIVAIGPRLLLGWLAGTIYHGLKKNGKSIAFSAFVSALISTVVHTAGVLGLILIFYAAPYASAIGVAQSGLMIAMATVILTNTVPEIVVAVVANVALTKALSSRK